MKEIDEISLQKVRKLYDSRYISSCESEPQEAYNKSINTFLTVYMILPEI